MNETIRLLLLGLPRTGEYVFPSPITGGKLNDIKTGFRGALSRAGITNFRFHDLRHTAATRMAEEGADAFTIMDSHSDIRMTVHYTRARNAAMRQAVANIGRNHHFGNELVTGTDFPSCEEVSVPVSY